MNAEEQATHDKAMDLVCRYGTELEKWKALAQKLTGVDANDHGWLRAQVDQLADSARVERSPVLPCLQPDATDSACKCCQRRFYRDEQSNVARRRPECPMGDKPCDNPLCAVRCNLLDEATERCANCGHTYYEHVRGREGCTDWRGTVPVVQLLPCDHRSGCGRVDECMAEQRCLGREEGNTDPTEYDTKNLLDALLSVYARSCTYATRPLHDRWVELRREVERRLGDAPKIQQQEGI